MFGTKKKLMAAVVMLVISAIMLTSASYAWFTISTNPEITGLDTQVAVHEALEIALAADDAATLPGNATAATVNSEARQYTWGNLVDLNQVTYYTTTLDKKLRPATIHDNKFKYPTYGNTLLDGRITGLSDLSQTIRDEGFGNLTDGADVYGYYVDFWVRSSVDGALVLQTAAANRETGSTTSGETGDAGGSYFQSNITAPTTPAELGEEATQEEIAARNATLAVIKAKNDAALELTKNIRVAFQDITTSAANVTGTPAITSQTPTFISNGQYKTTLATTDETGSTYDAITTLIRNQAKLIRMYVYLDGNGVSNLVASDDATSPDLVKGLLNIQFNLVTEDGAATTAASEVSFTNGNP